MTSLLRPGGTTIYISDDGSTQYYSYDNVSPIPISSWPVTIENTNTSAGYLKVLFTTSLILTNTNQFFACNSEKIQFGSPSLDSTTKSPTVITIGFNNYDGFIANGSSGTPGNNNIRIYNLIVDGSGFSTQISAGWIGKAYFGKNATNNYIVNCSSTGSLPGGPTGSGGIVGAYAGSGSGATLYIRGCSSSGGMGQLDGGILGGYAGQNGGTVVCEQCWSTGVINGAGAGGIFGENAGLAGNVTAIKCYSTGLIGNSAGGIYGTSAALSGQAVAEKCYSLGNISTNAGGIFGSQAGLTGGTTAATNCYSAGRVTTTGTGIYGSSKANGTETNCYAATVSWSSSSANLSLQGVPTDTVGTTWVASVINQPYELNEMGYTPYTVNIIDEETAELIQTFSETVSAGGTSSETLFADASGNSVVILKKEGGDPYSYNTITMNRQTGVISTTSDTVPGIYTLIVRNPGSYNITTFILTVNNSLESIACCDRPLQLQYVDYRTRAEIISGNSMIGNTSVRTQAMSYADLIRIKMAYASKY